jgi:leucyl-tRNA synthetase
MELVNLLYQLEPLEQNVSAKTLDDTLAMTVLLISPFAPHAAEELWERLGRSPSVAETPWPGYDAELAKEEEYEIVIQVNGRVRSRLRVTDDLGEQELLEQAMADPRVAGLIETQRVARTVVVPKKLINIVLTQ